MQYRCSINVLMHVPSNPLAGLGPRTWHRPPACLPHDQLAVPPNGARICVAGLVLVRQRPGTAHGVVFITLEDETSVCNVIVWKAVFERFRRAAIAGRLLRVTGRIQREGSVCHVVAEHIEDISHMLDQLVAETRPQDQFQHQINMDPGPDADARVAQDRGHMRHDGRTDPAALKLHIG